MSRKLLFSYVYSLLDSLLFLNIPSGVMVARSDIGTSWFILQGIMAGSIRTGILLFSWNWKNRKMKKQFHCMTGILHEIMFSGNMF